MLQPARTKYRKAHKGRIHGSAGRGESLNYGAFGLKAMQPERIVSNQLFLLVLSGGDTKTPARCPQVTGKKPARCLQAGERSQQGAAKAAKDRRKMLQGVAGILCVPGGFGFWLYFLAPKRPCRRSWDYGATTAVSFSAPETAVSRIFVLAVFPNPREATQWEFESSPQGGVLYSRCSGEACFQEIVSGGISTPQRGHAVGA